MIREEERSSNLELAYFLTSAHLTNHSTLDISKIDGCRIPTSERLGWRGFKTLFDDLTSTLKHTDAFIRPVLKN